MSAVFAAIKSKGRDEDIAVARCSIATLRAKPTVSFIAVMHFPKVGVIRLSRGDTPDDGIGPYAAADRVNNRFGPCLSASDHGNDENRHSRSPQYTA